MGIFKAAGQFITGQYKESAEEVWKLIQGWKFFAEHEVVVGITEESNVSEGPFTSAGLLYLHEQGVPSRNIPPRAVLEPALAQEDVKENIENMMMDAAEAALVQGNVELAMDCFEKAGMLGRDACRDYVTSGKVSPQNAPSTIAVKKRKGDNGKGSPVALIDTGAMVDSFSYAVRKK